MARDLPARSVLNGLETGKTGRDALGRFTAGAPPGPGRPVANPFARYQGELRGVLLAEVTPGDLRAILRTVLRLAKRGNLAATELVLRYTLGGPPPAVDPDRLDEHEISVRRGRPTLVDALTLADEQADREPADDEAPTDEPEDDDPDDPRAPTGPPLRTVLAWAIEELAQAQTALRMQRPPPDPKASWETFAARLEWDDTAAVPVDTLYLRYARWCANHGEPVLAEERALAWLQAHGATLRTGALTQTTMLVGVRVAE
jgi:hypothetical protein